MYLIKNVVEAKSGEDAAVTRQSLVRGLSAWLIKANGWWKQRVLKERRRQARKRLFLVESLVLGPKQKVVLMRCGREQFLVGTGPEGIQSIVPIGGEPAVAPSALRARGEKQCG